jgi:hypothetical protein
MPATRPTTLPQRQEILSLAASGLTTAAIARELKLAPRTVRKWRSRTARAGLAGLTTRLGRPRRGPLAGAPDLVRYLALRLKRQHPTWGAAYVVKKLREHPALAGQGVPDPTSLWRYWRGFGQRLLLRRPRPQPKPPACGVVHGVWQLDFKESLPVPGVGPVTITHARDQAGRATVCHRIHPAERPEQVVVKLTSTQVQADCRIAFSTWGLPDAIRTDRASLFHDDDPSPFPTRLSLWWVGLGIEPQWIRRGLPEDNGSVERAHRTADERTLRGQRFAGADHLQQQLAADWHELNFECSSRARGCHHQPPVVAHPELVQPRRAYRPEWEAKVFELARVDAYLASRSWVRTVSGRGQVSLGNHHYHVNFALQRQTVQIHFDPDRREFVFTPLQPTGGPAVPDPAERRRPAYGLSAADLIGPLDLGLDQPVRQLSFLFPLKAIPAPAPA